MAGCPVVYRDFDKMSEKGVMMEASRRNSVGGYLYRNLESMMDASYLFRKRRGKLMGVRLDV